MTRAVLGSAAASVRPEQQKLQIQNAYAEREFPKLDFIKDANIL